MIYSFDDTDIGLTEGGHKLAQRLLERPLGISQKEWLPFAAAITTLLNGLAAGKDARIKELEEKVRIGNATQAEHQRAAPTAIQLAEALDCFHNGAMQIAHHTQAGATALETISAIVEGVNAIGARLRLQAGAFKEEGQGHGN